MVLMPRFQSRLFNWIDQSLPAKLGRSARRLLDRQLKQIPPIQDLPRLFAYQVAKAALYPVYLIASTTKRIFPALGRSKDESKEQLRSQEVTELLLESESVTENIKNSLQAEQNFPKPEIPWLLRPLAKFLNWIDRTKITLDRNIAAIVKRQPDNLATSDHPELEPKLLANRIFAEIWQQQVEQRQAAENALKESNDLAENVALGKNKSLEQLRRLIEAAIAYFFGSSSNLPSNNQDSRLDGEQKSPELLDSESPNLEALPDSPNLTRRRIVVNGDLKANAPIIKSNNIERLRALIAAAIDYFIGKRSLHGDANSNSDIQGLETESLTGKSSDKLQTSFQGSPNREQTSSSVDSERSDALKIDDQFERLLKIIEAAIAYFFGKQLSQPTLDETNDITPSEESWLTMEDIFGDDNGPWPLPLEYESQAFTKSPDIAAINSSGELQNFETTTTKISQDRLEGSLRFEEELLAYQGSTENENERPLRAWLEANASLLGYVYNPVMIVVFWLDAIVLKIENLIIAIWKGVINFPKRLIRVIRYGNRKRS